MSYSFNGSIILGYSIPFYDVQKLFLIKTQGVFHMEDRFDIKTGSKLDQIKVWDKLTQDNLIYKGKEYKSGEEFTELLEEVVCCRVTEVINDEHQYIFHPEMPSPSTGGREEDRGVSFGPSYWFKDFVALDMRLKRIKGSLKKMGLHPGEPEIKLVVQIM